MSWLDQSGADGNFNWNCMGSGGGGNAACSATKASSGVAGLCGSGNGMVDLTAQPSGSAACAAGSFADLADTSTDFNWSCVGSGGGGTETCKAQIKKAVAADCPRAYYTPIGWFGDRPQFLQCCNAPRFYQVAPGQPQRPVPTKLVSMTNGQVRTERDALGHGTITFTCTNGVIDSQSTCTGYSGNYCNGQANY